MEQNELTHWGILGMKWGVRRYQNKDGSLTPAGKKRQKAKEAEVEETPEQKRARLLKSTDANELYKERALLTTAEINERLSRIDTERRLGEVAARTKKTGMERLDKVLKTARKVDEAYKFVSESYMGKQLMKSLGLSKDSTSKTTDYLKKKVGEFTDDELKNAVTRMQREKTFNGLLKELDEAKNPKKTATKNLIGDLSDLTDDQVKDVLNRLRDEETVRNKLSNR